MTALSRRDRHDISLASNAAVWAWARRARKFPDRPGAMMPLLPAQRKVGMRSFDDAAPR